MAVPLSERVRKHRRELRAAGLRPLQIWVPDTRSPGFEVACREQVARAAAAEDTDKDLARIMHQGWRA
jgi:hypothetical protein